MQRPTLTVTFAAIVASGATLMLALAPAFAPGQAPAAAADGLRIVELPRVVVTATREPKVVELPRVVISARRDTAQLAELPRVVITAKREARGDALLAAAGGHATQPVMAARSL